MRHPRLTAGSAREMYGSGQHTRDRDRQHPWAQSSFDDPLDDLVLRTIRWTVVATLDTSRTVGPMPDLWDRCE
jgi:hypothetical protein